LKLVVNFSYGRRIIAKIKGSHRYMGLLYCFEAGTEDFRSPAGPAIKDIPEQGLAIMHLSAIFGGRLVGNVGFWYNG